MLIAVGDNVWIEGFRTFGLIFIALMTFFTLLVNLRAAARATKAEVKVEEVKQTLAKTNTIVSEKLDVIHELTNSGMLEQKKLSMIHARRAAELSGDDPVDVEAARLAEAAYEQHRAHQECVDDKKKKT